MGCTGTPESCAYHDEFICEWCGCYWSASCKGTPWLCSYHTEQSTCQNCGCDWVGTNMKINIGDSWRIVEEIKINVGDSWRTVTKIQINIGDTWRTVFG